MIISTFGGFEKTANSVVRSQKNNRKTRNWTTPKRVRIHPIYSSTIAFSWQEDKDGAKQKTSCKNQKC